MKSTLAHIIDGANGGLESYNSKLVVFNDELFVFLPKDNFKEVQKLLIQLGLRINGNETNYSMAVDVSYKVEVLPDAIKSVFKLTNDPNGNIKLEFKKTAENGSYYYFGQHSPTEVEKIMRQFIKFSMGGFYDEEICKLFERKYRRK